MRDYFYFIIILSLICSVGVYLCREGMRPVLRCALSLVMVLSAMSPLVELIRDIPRELIALPEAGAVEDTEYYAVCTEAFCRGVEESVAEEFGLSEGEVRAECRGLSLTELRCSELRLTLSGKGVRIDRERVRRFALELTLDGGGITVEYEI